jgi:hypothetical protein
MTVMDFLNQLEQSPVAAAVRGDSGWEWLFPNIETLHVLSLAVVFGSVLMVDLRLLGVASRSNAVSKLSVEVLPFTWIAFVAAVITGTLMFISKAHIYFYNLQFQLKFLCIFLAGINMLAFHFGAYRNVLSWDNRLPTPIGAQVAGALSIALWIGVIFFGRWIGFTT